MSAPDGALLLTDAPGFHQRAAREHRNPLADGLEEAPSERDAPARDDRTRDPK